MNGDERDNRNLPDDQGMQECLLPLPGDDLTTVHHLVVADGEIIYDGYDSREMVRVWWAACKTDARLISHFVDDIEVGQTMALDGWVPKSWGIRK